MERATEKVREQQPGAKNTAPLDHLHGTIDLILLSKYKDIFTFVILTDRDKYRETVLTVQPETEAALHTMNMHRVGEAVRIQT